MIYVLIAMLNNSDYIMLERFKTLEECNILKERIERAAEEKYPEQGLEFHCREIK